MSHLGAFTISTKTTTISENIQCRLWHILEKFKNPTLLNISDSTTVPKEPVSTSFISFLQSLLLQD